MEFFFYNMIVFTAFFDKVNAALVNIGDFWREM